MYDLSAKQAIDIGNDINELVAICPDIYVGIGCIFKRSFYNFYSKSVVPDKFEVFEADYGDVDCFKKTFKPFKIIKTSKNKKCKVYLPEDQEIIVTVWSDGEFNEICVENEKSLANMNKNCSNKMENEIIQFIIKAIKSYEISKEKYYCSDALKEQIEIALIML